MADLGTTTGSDQVADFQCTAMQRSFPAPSLLTFACVFYLTCPRSCVFFCFIQCQFSLQAPEHRWTVSSKRLLPLIVDVRNSLLLLCCFLLNTNSDIYDILIYQVLQVKLCFSCIKGQNIKKYNWTMSFEWVACNQIIELLISQAFAWKKSFVRQLLDYEGYISVAWTNLLTSPQLKLK